MSIHKLNGSLLPVSIQAGSVILEGDLGIPKKARGIVLFAHGSGSSRHSPRNRYVAESLREGGLATFLIDLLTSEEEKIDMITRRIRFDIALLSDRLIKATDWLLAYPDTRNLNIGYFGASTGAAAALIAAAKRPEAIHAVVSRGGRPDLAKPFLSQVKTPTLLIVGGNDFQVIDLNREALAQMDTEKRLDIVPGATHLFEEEGALAKVAQLAYHWLRDHLIQGRNGNGNIT